MNFGLATSYLKAGKKVARVVWNGKGMFLYYVPSGVYPARMDAIKGHFPNDEVPYDAYIAMKTAGDTVVPWLASQADVLADDYVIVE